MKWALRKLLSIAIRIGIVIGLIVVIWECFYGVQVKSLNRDKKLPGDVITHPATVTRVIDGDTFEADLNGETITVRLIGVDSPESVHPDEAKNTEEGILASNYTKEKLEGKEVELEYDVETEDSYGRTLAYVWLDGELYNKKLLDDGYAVLMTIPPNIKYVDVLLSK